MRTHAAVALSSQPENNAEAVDERSWLARHCAGDKTAFPSLVEAYQRPLYTYLARCGVHPDSRDDVFQDIFIKIHLAARSYQSNRPLRPWLFAIATNTVRNHFRARRAQPRGVAPAEDFPDHRTPERQAEIRERVAQVEREIGALPLAQREVLVLSTLQDMRLSDIAASLGLPLNTVKTRLRRARLQLAARLADAARIGAGESHEAL